MATIPGYFRTKNVGHSESEQGSRNQRRRDRITALLVALGVIALMVLLIWLMSLGGSPPPPDFDSWMMP